MGADSCIPAKRFGFILLKEVIVRSQVVVEIFRGFLLHNVSVRRCRSASSKQSRFARPFDDVLAGFVLDPGFDLEAVLRAIDRAYDEMRGHRLAEVDRKQELEGLRPVDGAGPGQQHPDHRGEDRRGQHSLKDAAAKLRFARELFVDVKRIHVAGDLDEAPHVIFGKRLAEADMLPNFKVLDPRNHDDRDLTAAFGVRRLAAAFKVS